MDRERAQVVPLRTGKSRQRGLERDFKELCEDSYANTSGQPRSETLPPAEQSQPASPSI